MEIGDDSRSRPGLRDGVATTWAYVVLQRGDRSWPIVGANAGERRPGALSSVTSLTGVNPRSKLSPNPDSLLRARWSVRLRHDTPGRCADRCLYQRGHRSHRAS